MADATQVLTVGLPTLAVLIGILVNNSRLGDTNKRIDDLRAHMDGRLDDLRADMDGRFTAVDRGFTAVDDKFGAFEKLFMERLRRLEEVLDARLSRIEGELYIR